MPSKFNDYIRSGGNDIVFASMSSFDAPLSGSKIMLVQDGLMGFGAGRMFTVSSKDECRGGQKHKYKGIGEAYLLDDEGNPHIVMAGKDILNNSFIIVENKTNDVVEEEIEPSKPKTETLRENVEPIIIERVGKIGERGVEGIPGNRGSRGSQGLKGDKGTKGDRGERGEIGLRGPQGFRGEKGERGEQGQQGEEGSQGIQGIQGIRGVSGEKGEKGEKGERGEQGTQGLEGSQGERGEKGERGERGEKGAKGDQGERGVAGEKGERGEQGEIGSQGIQGVAGENGAVGKQGEQGKQGVRGEKGDQGKDGLNGKTGEKGDKGDQGDKGDIGEMPFLTVQHPLTLKNKSLGIDIAKLKKTIGGGGGGQPILYDGGGGLGTAFKTISVTGQADLNAVQYDAETLTIAAYDASISITTDPTTNTVYLQSTGTLDTVIDGGVF